MTTELDLQQLAVERREPPKAKRRKKNLLTRYVLPAVIVLGFLGMLGWAARERLLPVKQVTVVPVVVTRAELQQAGTPLFQAAGWIEPRPTPVFVSALTEGVVEELLVVEGQEVKAGEPVARLIDVDARLILEQAETELALRQAELDSAKAELRAARLRLENPVHLKAPLAEAESLLAKTQTEMARIPFLIEAAEARIEFARQNLEGRQAASSTIAGRLVQQARSEHDGALAELKELRARGPRLEAEVDALRQKRAAVAEQLKLMIDESRQVADAEAQVKAAEARERQARLAIEKAQLQLDRTIVKSQMDGRVLSLVARPGTRLMGLDPTAEHKSSTVVILYDPNMLQVRADVRLEDVPLVQPGQPVQIETASSKAPLDGVVLFPTSTANIQKNTLEVKVAIQSPPPAIRPEMLVTATFLALPRPESDSGSSEQERLLVPRQLVDSSGDGHAIWLADPSGVARRRMVRLGKAGTEELVEVVEGLHPTDKLISGGREGLTDGDRIAIAGEDSSLGLTAMSGT